MPSVRADGEQRLDREVLALHARAYAGYAPLALDQTHGLAFHQQSEGRALFPVLGQKVEKVPLRHERNELAACREMREVSDFEALVADLGGYLVHFLVRPFQELVEKPK